MGRRRVHRRRNRPRHVSGELLAEWAHGDDSDLLRDMRALPGPGRTPPEPFLSLGIRWKVSRMNASAGEWL